MKARGVLQRARASSPPDRTGRGRLAPMRTVICHRGAGLARALPRPDRREMAAVFAGGALGTLARAGLAEAFPHSATAWPWPTFAVNIVAACLLGYFVTRLQERLPLSSYRRPLLGTGLCGGLSTFSTMQLEIVKMLDAHAWGLAVGYTAAGRSRPGTRPSSCRPPWCRRVRVRVAMSILVWTLVVLIGGAGFAAALLPRREGRLGAAARDIPVGTMVINVSGAVVLGLLSGLALSSPSTCCSGPRRSAPTPASPPGCWRRSGSPRSGSTARQCSTSSSAWLSASPRPRSDG